MRRAAPHAVILTLLFASIVACPVRAQEACEDALYVHNYPVLDADAYSGLFDTVEGYVAGPEAEAAWPFADDAEKSYPTRDFCPLDPEGRLVRLFEVPPGEARGSSFQAGTLTLVARDLAAARDAASALAAEGPRDSQLEGRRSFSFTDAAGNELFVWEFPGPPDS